MSLLLPNYLRTLRMRWGLSQRELATILGVSESALSLCETQERRPTVNLLIGTEVIFGESARDAFPALYAQTERNIMHRTAALSKRLEHESDGVAKMKRKLLTEMIDRSEVDNKHL
jgi:transcriptional regulator with XRE-family HTH domain